MIRDGDETHRKWVQREKGEEERATGAIWKFVTVSQEGGTASGFTGIVGGNLENRVEKKTFLLSLQPVGEEHQGLFLC